MPEVINTPNGDSQRKVRRRFFLRVGLVLLLGLGGVSALTLVAVNSISSLLADTTGQPGASSKPKPVPGDKSRPKPSPSVAPSVAPSESPSTRVTPSPSARATPAPTNPNATTIVDDGLTDITGSTSSIRLNATASTALRPGVRTPLNMSFTNQGHAAVTVDHVFVSISSVTAPRSTPTLGCTAADFYVEQIPSTFAVALGSLGTASLSALGTPTSGWPVIGMVESVANQDGCKGASVNLAYSAWGHN